MWDAKPKSKTCFLLSRILSLGPGWLQPVQQGHVFPVLRDIQAEKGKSSIFLPVFALGTVSSGTAPARRGAGLGSARSRASDASSIHLVAPFISKKLGVAFALTLQQSTQHVTHIPPPPRLCRGHFPSVFVPLLPPQSSSVSQCLIVHPSSCVIWAPRPPWRHGHATKVRDKEKSLLCSCLHAGAS